MNQERCSDHGSGPDLRGPDLRGPGRPRVPWRVVTVEQSTPFWGPDFDALQQQDPEIAGVVLDELERLRGGLQLIASENLTSPAVLAALGSTLSNKYAEGYPGRRYYGGCQVVDRAEEIGIARTQGAVRRRARQPAAALGRVGQPRGVRRVHPARRHRAGHGPQAGRAPHARQQGQLLRQVVQRRVLHGAPRTPS